MPVGLLDGLLVGITVGLLEGVMGTFKKMDSVTLNIFVTVVGFAWFAREIR